MEDTGATVSKVEMGGGALLYFLNAWVSEHEPQGWREEKAFP